MINQLYELLDRAKKEKDIGLATSLRDVIFRLSQSDYLPLEKETNTNGDNNVANEKFAVKDYPIEINCYAAYMSGWNKGWSACCNKYIGEKTDLYKFQNR